jgi:multiple sugar transport system substrate-binding protein
MKKHLALCACLLTALALSGCSSKSEPIMLTMWHNFGGDLQMGIDGLIDEFNATVGRENGIAVNVAAITSSAELQEALSMIVNNDPGAPEMPDIFTSYPKTAILFQQKGMLANLDDYFTAEEQAAYVPAFMDEGRFGDGGLYVFPFAKSTELLYLNQTLFDEFAAEAGVTMACFDSFEGIADSALKYYEWTDGMTPEVPNDGKMFYTSDSWLNLAQAGMLQQGSNLFENETLNLNAAYSRIWQTLFAPSVSGGFAIYDGYSSDLSKTGDIVCSTGSSAGVLFYGDTITYPDNVARDVEYSILPFPVFEGGEKYAIQRGNGLAVKKSGKAREKSAAAFVKWFTAPEQNMRFTAQTGYMPVTKEAFEIRLPGYSANVENPKIKMMLEAVTEMYGSYSFFVAPVFDEIDAISKDYESSYKTLLTEEREAWIASGGDASARMDEALAELTKVLKK